ncbi:terminase small subunit [Pseudomonas aeruginosa]|uniref:terminase small subunit n=1 Tax=Pseudomonas aeruginosa TaxID=287 RepID=UPI0035BE6CE8
MALTDKQRRFVDAKARGASNKEAAEAAGYAPSSAAVAGSRLAKHPDVVAELQKLTAPRNVNPRPPLAHIQTLLAIFPIQMASSSIAFRLPAIHWCGCSR